MTEDGNGNNVMAAHSFFFLLFVLNIGLHLYYCWLSLSLSRLRIPSELLDKYLLLDSPSFEFVDTNLGSSPTGLRHCHTTCTLADVEELHPCMRYHRETFVFPL